MSACLIVHRRSNFRLYFQIQTVAMWLSQDSMPIVIGCAHYVLEIKIASALIQKTNVHW